MTDIIIRIIIVQYTIAPRTINTGKTRLRRHPTTHYRAFHLSTSVIG